MRKMLVFLPYELSIYREILYWKYSILWLCTVHVSWFFFFRFVVFGLCPPLCYLQYIERI